jgi:hypothetical protein
MARTYREQMQDIANRYTRSGAPWPATARQIAAWAIREKLWAPQPSSLIAQCADQLARAMREEFITDPQGRTVRAKHAARMREGNRQITLWADIRSAPRRHLEVAFQQRRQQILGDCHQLKHDVDSFNDNRAAEQPIQTVFDFTRDLAEYDAADAATHLRREWAA